MLNRFRHPVGWLRVGAVATMLATGAAGAEAPPRFVPLGELTGLHADWVSFDVDRVAFGSGRRVAVASALPIPVLLYEIELAEPVRAAELVEGTLYYQTDAGLFTLPVDRSEPARPLELQPPPSGPVRLAKLGKWLIVAEDDAGLRVHRLPSAHAGHGGTGTPYELVGALELHERFRFITIGISSLYLGTQDGELLEIALDNPGRPRLTGRSSLVPGTTGAAANGSELYLAAPGGLMTTPQDRVDFTLHTDAGGFDAELAGRLLFVAAGEKGLRVFRDATEGLVTHRVDLGPMAFSPQSLTIDVGDRVRWVNPFSYDPPARVGATLHSVRSCLAATPDCTGVATEVFTNGGPMLGPWVLLHTFTLSGENPYVCEVHSLVGMTGNVSVAGAAVSPPGVPDGTVGTSMTVSKLTPFGTSLSVSWDTAFCTDAADYQIVWGGRSQLPAVPGGIYALGGSRCNLGLVTPANWTNTPDPALDPGGMIWWLIVATDGALIEGSWGDDSAGFERIGPGTGGVSGQCGVTGRDLTNACGH